MTQPTNGLSQRWQLWLAAIVALYITQFFLLRPVSYLDSFAYAKHIVDHNAGRLSPYNDPYYDFGHVLLRPLGSLVWVPFGDLIAPHFGGDPIQSAALALIVWNAVAGLLAAVFLFLLLARACGNARVAGICCIAFLFTHAMMNYSKTGNAYAVGIAFQSAGLYLIFRIIQLGRYNWGTSLASGALLGASVAIWFPYCLSLPGLVCFSLIWKDRAGSLNLRTRFMFAFRICLGAALVIGAAYAYAMASRHIATFNDLRAWIAASRHDIAPTHGFARMLFAVPRSFFVFDGSAWKQFVLGSSVSTWQLLGVWKHVTVYLAFAAVLWTVFRTGWGPRILACLACIALPLIVFAAFMFDPAPPERYMAVFPMLFLAFAMLLVSHETPLVARGLVLMLFVGMIAANSAGMWRHRESPAETATIGRLEELNRHIGPRDVALVPGFKDDALAFINEQPFHPASRKGFQIGVALSAGGNQARMWREELARRIKVTWRLGGQVWLSERLFQQRPSAPWWIEGDESRIRWADVYAFCRGLEYDISTGRDGFVRVISSPRNLARLGDPNDAQAGPAVSANSVYPYPDK